MDHRRWWTQRKDSIREQAGAELILPENYTYPEVLAVARNRRAGRSSRCRLRRNVRCVRL